MALLVAVGLALALGLVLQCVAGPCAVGLLRDDMDDVFHLQCVAVEACTRQGLQGVGGEGVRYAIEDCALKVLVVDGDASC